MSKYYGVGQAEGQLYLVEQMQSHLEFVDRGQMIYEFIESYLAIKKRPPTGQEISGATRIPQSLVNYWLWKLHDEGKITRKSGVARGITLCQNS